MVLCIDGILLIVEISFKLGNQLHIHIKFIDLIVIPGVS